MSEERSLLRHPLVRSIVMAAAALLLYGGWACFANRQHGAYLALRAGATQGFVSFTVTFLITAVMEYLHRQFARPWVGFVAASAGAIALTTAYTVSMHLWMGTPEILATVAPVLSLGSLYCLVYTANLSRESRQQGLKE